MSHSILKGVKDEFVVSEQVKVWQDSKTHQIVPAKFRFRRPNRSELTELSQTINEAMRTSDFDRIAEIIRGYLIGWEMPGNDGQPVEFCDENIELVLEHPDYLSGIIDAFVKLLNPSKAKAKN